MSTPSVSGPAFTATAPSYRASIQGRRGSSAQSSLNAQPSLKHDELHFSHRESDLKTASAKKSSESQNEKHQEAKHLGLLSRGWKLLTAPISAVFKAFRGGMKAILVSLLSVGALAALKQRKAALAVGALSFITVPLYAFTSGIGRFFSNIKQAITGRRSGS